MSVVVAPQFFVNDRELDQPDGVPFRLIARTRHQYVPFGAVSMTVARVFFVRKSSLPAPSTGELKPASAAIWNSYSEAPATGFQPNAGMLATAAPLPGVVGTGAGRAPPEAAPTSSSVSTTRAAGMAIRLQARRVRATGGFPSSPNFPSLRLSVERVRAGSPKGPGRSSPSGLQAFSAGSAWASGRPWW